MNNYALNCSIVALSLATTMITVGQAQALSFSPAATKPTLQNTVLKSSLPPNYKTDKRAKVIQAAYKKNRKKSSKTSNTLRDLKAKLTDNNFSEIYFTKRSGTILEAEACKNDKRYFLQIAHDGALLQATQFDFCKSPKIKKNSESVLDQEAAVPVALNEPVQPQEDPVDLTPKTRKNATKKALTLSKILKQRGYQHIYMPSNRKLGVMACKNGVEYAFKVTSPTVSSWQHMISKRRSLGKCFGYGKQILSLNDLLEIMHRHGDTQIRVVSGNLPMFEAYSCHKGQRRHVKINRWGNDNIRPAGKCS